MNIILLEKIKKLGDIGDEVSVKSGYARNFLVPNKKALYATPDNRKYFEDKKIDINTQNQKLIKEAKENLKKLSGIEVVLIRAASESGQLFGSVSTKDIANYLAEKNITIEKNKIDLNKSIKNLTYEKINIHLHAEVSCEIILNVARSLEEASKQKQIGKTITSNTENIENKNIEFDEVKEKKVETNNLDFSNKDINEDKINKKSIKKTKTKIDELKDKPSQNPD